MPPVTSRAPRRERPSASATGVVGHGPGVGLERRLAGLGERDRLGGHHVAERATEHHRAAAVDRVGELRLAQHHAAARAAQRLVRRRRRDVGVRHGVEVAGEHLAGDEPGEVGHVDHQHGADLVGDLAHRREVDLARVRRVAGDQHQRAELPRPGPHGGVVQQPGVGIGAVRRLVEHLAADVRAEAVGQVTAGVERHAQRPLVAQREAELLPVGVGQVVDVRRPQLGERRRLDPLGEDRPERDQVGVDARVRLHVRVGRTEQRLGVVGGRLLDDVDVLAAGVEPVTDRALGVLVRQPRAHRQQRRRATRSSRWRSASATRADRSAPGGSPPPPSARRRRSHRAHSDTQRTQQLRRRVR